MRRASSKVADNSRSNSRGGSFLVALALAAVMVMTTEWKSCDGCLEHERVALLDIRAFFGDDRLFCPPPSGGDCCAWCGVTCSDTTGRVIELRFIGPMTIESLRGGYLNASLFLPFQELRLLELQFYKLSGCMENEGFEKLSKLVNLEVLDLEFNGFGNDILSSLSKLSSLKSLNLYGNRLKGMVDVDELNKLSGLKELCLGNNEIEGFKSYHGDGDLLRLSHLDWLDLSVNHFSNDTLSSLSRLTSLEALDLNQNRLNGTVDVDELNKLSGLKELQLGGNEIEGFTSFHGNETLLRLPHLERLGLYNNSIRSTVVFSAFKELYSLQYLSLDSNNLLEGSVDMKDLAALTKLQELELTGNLVVKDLAALINLERLQLGVDEPPFPLEHAYNFLRNMKHSFDFQGSSKLEKLEELSIVNSVVEGNFFERIGTLMTNLTHLTILSSPSLVNSTIPQGSSKLEKLEELSIVNSVVEGNFFERIGTLMTNLTHLTILSSPSIVNSTIPQGLCKLKHLQEIDLWGNDLVGELPRCLSNLTSLQFLDISHNQLSGDISLSPLTTIFSLETIDISHNLFRIPFSLSPFYNHSHLQIFYGDYNREIYEDEHHEDIKQQGTFLLHPPLFQLTDLFLGSSKDNDNIGGIFPKFLYYQHELVRVNISNSKLERAGFPSWLLVNNTNLRELTIVNCSLSGPFQLPFHKYPHENLWNLDVSMNNLHSPIPTHICAFLPELQTLSLSENRLFGRIPEYLSNCSNLYTLDVGNNNLSGKIPRWLGNFSYLYLLDLSKNNFSGSLPSNFITSLMLEVYLSRNQLEGALTSGDHGISSAHNDYSSYSLSVLDLSHNHLSGTIPRWISKLPRLSYLLLNNNEFYGEIPIPFHLEQVKLIVISHNHLSGRLSSVLTSNRSLVPYYGRISKDLELVTKTKVYTYTGKPLQLMSGIDLSNNNFVGEIPPQISDKDDMKFLNLSNNKLTGSIPPSFSRLLQIESLDLSHNNLSGVIPPGLTALTSLASFSVAYNNLSGNCPDQRVAQFGTFNESSYQGNPFLCCTFMLRPSEPLLKQPNSDDGDDDDGGSFIDMESFYASSGVSFVMMLLTIAIVLYINPYWRGVWFYYVKITITGCYYFVVDHLPLPTKYKVLELRV